MPCFMMSYFSTAVLMSLRFLPIHNNTPIHQTGQHHSNYLRKVCFFLYLIAAHVRYSAISIDQPGGLVDNSDHVLKKQIF